MELVGLTPRLLSSAGVAMLALPSQVHERAATVEIQLCGQSPAATIRLNLPLPLTGLTIGKARPGACMRYGPNARKAKAEEIIKPFSFRGSLANGSGLRGELDGLCSKAVLMKARPRAFASNSASAATPGRSCGPSVPM